MLAVVENIVGKKDIASYLHFLFLYARQRRDVLQDHPWCPGGVPILCPEHISKTMLATVMKFHWLIDIVKAECSAQES